MVIQTPFAIQRQSSPMARRDKTWSSAPFLLSRDNQGRCPAETKHGHPHPFLLSKDNQVRWHVETKHGHPYLLCSPKTIKSDGTRRQNMVIHTLFVIQIQSSPMACGDKTWSSAPFLLSKENLVRWYTEKKDDHTHPFSNPETIKSDGTQRQNMVIRTFFTI